jgi:hypothetical protein
MGSPLEEAVGFIEGESIMTIEKGRHIIVFLNYKNLDAEISLFMENGRIEHIGMTVKGDKKCAHMAAFMQDFIARLDYRDWVERKRSASIGNVNVFNKYEYSEENRIVIYGIYVDKKEEIEINTHLIMPLQASSDEGGKDLVKWHFVIKKHIRLHSTGDTGAPY